LQLTPLNIVFPFCVPRRHGSFISRDLRSA
jgi:hypothetical protein